ncbi:E3 ubiquitin-protein ligase rnf8 [Desmophyllum pertusum]|uniref:E3 ubiquitin-protein ligase rnf8 n=1 Tax=Desmophyllum pertusum TaxID=174260 RepID=A0A9W9YS59_9CNID|nr:E3 ubiquitin-protein ligase rnf8 [Desmophyllum pertusum]
MEDEFTCIICQDLFINSTTLPCAHSFCEHCLKAWLQKKNNCPICRQPIMGRPVRSLVLDNAIAKMVESMDEETKTRRQTVSQEREEFKRAAVRATAGARDRPISVNDGTPRHHQGQGNAVTPGMAQNMVRHVRPREPYVRGIQIQEQRAAAHQRNEYNRYYGNHGGGGYRYGGGDYVRELYQPNYVHGGAPGAYHPAGYGHNPPYCHLCGMRGHWARSCPHNH